MLWGYHTISPPTKTQDETDSPHHPSDADNNGADNNDADNDATDDDTDNNANNATTMQTTMTMQPQTMLP